MNTSPQFLSNCFSTNFQINIRRSWPNETHRTRRMVEPAFLCSLYDMNNIEVAPQMSLTGNRNSGFCRDIGIRSERTRDNFYWCLRLGHLPPSPQRTSGPYLRQWGTRLCVILTNRSSNYSDWFAKKRFTVELGCNDIRLYDTLPITSDILWCQLIPHC